MTKSEQYAVESSHLGTQQIKLGHMVLKGVNWLHNNKIRLIVLKDVIRVHNEEIRIYDLDRSQLGTAIQKSSHMVMKGVNLLQKAKIWSYGLVMSQMSKLGTQCTNIRSNGLKRSQLSTQ